MDFIDDVIKTEPLLVNDKGVKFWLDKDTTQYAKYKGLTDIVVFYLEEPNGRLTRLITEQKNGQSEELYDSQSLEAIAAHIDFIKLSRE